MPPFRNHDHHFRDDDDKSCVKVCGTLLLANYANPHFPLGDTLNCPDLHIITSTSPSSSPSPASPKKALLGVDHHWETSMMRWKLAPMVANYVLMVCLILHPFDHLSFKCAVFLDTQMSLAPPICTFDKCTLPSRGVRSVPVRNVLSRQSH